MDNKILLELSAFLSDHLTVDASKIKESTRIAQDLGVDGDDAYDLLLEYSRVFNVDITSFKYNDYFGPEGCNPFLVPIYWLGIRKLKPLTVGDLMAGVISGKL